MPDIKVPVKKKLSASEQRTLERALTKIANAPHDPQQLLTPSMAAHLLGLIGSYKWFLEQLASTGMTMAILRRVFGIPQRVKTQDGGEEGKVGSSSDKDTDEQESYDHQLCEDEIDEPAKQPGKGREKPLNKNKNHPGKRGSKDFPNAPLVEHSFTDLSAGSSCPQSGCSGKLYTFLRDGKPRDIVIFDTGPLLEAALHRFNELRCNVCEFIFTPDYKAKGVVESVDGRGIRFTRSALAMIAFCHVWAGLPYHRLAQMQGMMGFALSPSTLWDQLHKVSCGIKGFINYLRNLACTSMVAYTDDFAIQVNAEQAVLRKNSSDKTTYRDGTYTSVLIAILDDAHAVPLFSSGLKHAGENLKQIFSNRPPGLPPPNIVADRSKVTETAGIAMELSACLQHAREYFVKAQANHGAMAEAALQVFSEVFAIERETHALSPAERLDKLSIQALPKLEQLLSTVRSWQEDKLMTPRSALGRACAYYTEHFNKLTTSLRIAGLALTNNISEWSFMLSYRLKINSYFFATTKGANSCDAIMTVLLMAAMDHRNPWQYLNYLYSHHELIESAPSNYLPWNISLSEVGMFDGTCQDHWIPSPSSLTPA